MNDIWQRIEKWFHDNEPSYPLGLRNGATEEGFRQIENLIETQLPVDFRKSYAIHNGYAGRGLFLEGELLTLDEIYDWEYEIWDILRDDPYEGERTTPVGPIKPLYWTTLWVPFIDNGDRQLCVDLDPAEGGSFGQVIERYHGGGPTHVIANSFRIWLSNYADELEAGKYTFQDGPRLKNE